MDETKDIMDIAKPQWLEQMEGILETLNEGVLIAYADDHVLFVNSVFEEMTGIFRGDILDRDAAQLYRSPEDYAVVQRLRQKTLRMGRGAGRLSLEAWLLYATLFLWQFPDFMAIAGMYREDYARAIATQTAR